MDINTWNNLSKIEQEEIKVMGADFTRQVLNSNALDARDFWMKYEVRFDEDYYFIFEKSTRQKFGTFKSKSENVMNALMTNAIQNYGR
jgi:hypothetical protein